MLDEISRTVQTTESELCQKMSQNLRVDDHFVDYQWLEPRNPMISQLEHQNLPLSQSALMNQDMGNADIFRPRLNLGGTEAGDYSDLYYQSDSSKKPGNISSPFQNLTNANFQPRTGLTNLDSPHQSFPLKTSSPMKDFSLGDLNHVNPDFDVERARRLAELSSMEPKSEFLSLLPELVPSLKFASDSEVAGHIPSIESSSLRIPCSSCGALKPAKYLARLLPCRHPLCKTCVNALVNLSCNDPPPPETVCFLCSSPVTGFDPPTAFAINCPVAAPGGEPSPLSEFVSPVWYLNELDSIGTESAFVPNIFTSNWSSPSRLGDIKTPNNLDDGLAERLISQSNAPSRPLNSQWPVVRVDNIAWTQTVEGIKAWLPDNANCLPPPELCPLPIHILCTPEDGKTLNYCFIETRDLESAHLLVRSKHGTKIGPRPCSVGLTSSAELNSKVFGTSPAKDIWRNIELLLELCEPQKLSSVKAPERPFFHLMSILLHYEYVANGNEESEMNAIIEKWTNVLCAAVARLLQSRPFIPEFMSILITMINTGIVSKFVETLELSRFLTGLQQSLSVS